MNKRILLAIASLMLANVNASNSALANFTEIYSDGAVTADEVDALNSVEVVVEPAPAAATDPVFVDYERDEEREPLFSQVSSGPVTYKDWLVVAGIALVPVIYVVYMNMNSAK